jgi:hypothetical protein
MPLLDHFHSPLSDRRPRRGFRLDSRARWSASSKGRLPQASRAGG